jgi:hypothetical protein
MIGSLPDRRGEARIPASALERCGTSIQVGNIRAPSEHPEINYRPTVAGADRWPLPAGTAYLQEYPAGVEAPAGHLLADLVAFGEVFGARAGAGFLDEQRPGQQEAAGEPVGFLFFLGIAGEEVEATDALDGSGGVFEDDVGDLVGDVAVGAARVVSPGTRTAANATQPSATTPRRGWTRSRSPR